MYRTRFMGGLNEPNVPDALRAKPRKRRANSLSVDVAIDARRCPPRGGTTCNPDCNKGAIDCRNVASGERQCRDREPRTLACRLRRCEQTSRPMEQRHARLIVQSAARTRRAAAPWSRPRQTHQHRVRGRRGRTRSPPVRAFAAAAPARRGAGRAARRARAGDLAGRPRYTDSKRSAATPAAPGQVPPLTPRKQPLAQRRR